MHIPQNFPPKKKKKKKRRSIFDSKKWQPRSPKTRKIVDWASKHVYNIKRKKKSNKKLNKDQTKTKPRKKNLQEVRRQASSASKLLNDLSTTTTSLKIPSH